LRGAQLILPERSRGVEGNTPRKNGLKLLTGTMNGRTRGKSPRGHDNWRRSHRRMAEW